MPASRLAPGFPTMPPTNKAEREALVGLVLAWWLFPAWSLKGRSISSGRATLSMLLYRKEMESQIMTVDIML